jgi:hypothetical protein
MVSTAALPWRRREGPRQPQTASITSTPRHAKQTHPPFDSYGLKACSSDAASYGIAECVFKLTDAGMDTEPSDVHITASWSLALYTIHTRS